MTEATPHQRLLSLDWLRGFVMILMAFDHASMFFNGGRFARDTILHYHGGAIPLVQFLVRWMTHLCAPTFAFLVGVGIALRVAKGIAQSESSHAIDRYLWTRGALLVLLDLVLFSGASGRPLLQVLYALGFGMLAMVGLRRLPVAWVGGLALGWIACGELLTSLLWHPTSGNAPLYLAPWIGVHTSPKAIIIYPALHWLAIILLGWCFGHYLQRCHRQQDTRSPIRLLWLGGTTSLVLFAIVRGLNGYGNMSLYRATDAINHPIVQWLLVSKYPPSISFITLELGLMALLLALLLKRQQHRVFRIQGPFLVFGQTALFFYLLHFISLALTKQLTGASLRSGIPGTLLFTACLLLILYPICRWYRTYKRNHANLLTRYI